MTKRTEVIGRYELHRRIASGGMAAVHFGRLRGGGGFSRAVAVKRLHPHFATDPMFVDTLLDEARLVSRIRHPNVVPVLDVVHEGDQVLLVLEYIHGLAASTLVQQARPSNRQMPAPVAVAIMADVLRGLHAAHDATAADGTPLGLVHRDVSPQNILVTTEGVSLIADFGIAKAAGRAHTTRDGSVKGKLAYMAPEQLSGADVSRRTDVHAAAAVLWELIAGQRLFDGDSDAAVYTRVIQHVVPPLGDIVPEVEPAVSDVVSRALSREPAERFDSALDMATALERAGRPSTRAEVAAWVTEVAGDTFAERSAWLAEMELDDAPPAPADAAAASSLAAPPAAASPAVETPTARRRAPRLVPILGLLSLAALGVWIVMATRAPVTEGEVPVRTSVAPSAAPRATAQASASPEVAASAVPLPPSAESSAAEAPKVPVVRPRQPKPAVQPCRKLGADGIWRIEQCPVD